MEDFKMDEKGQTKDSRNMHAIILAVLGIILVIIGEAIINIRGAPMRGSGARHSLGCSRCHTTCHCCLTVFV